MILKKKIESEYSLSNRVDDVCGFLGTASPLSPEDE